MSSVKSLPVTILGMSYHQMYVEFDNICILVCLTFLQTLFLFGKNKQNM